MARFQNTIYSCIGLILLALPLCTTLSFDASAQGICRINLQKEADPVDGTEFQLQLRNEDGGVISQQPISDGFNLEIALSNSFDETFTLVELVPEGWFLLDMVCSNESNVIVGPFEDNGRTIECVSNPSTEASVDCTLINELGCSVDVNLVTVPSADVIFDFSAPGSSEPEFPLNDQGQNSNTIFLPLNEDIDITQITPPGWLLFERECTQVDGAENRAIPDGVAVTCDAPVELECTFTNILVRSVPTLSEWGLIALALFIGIVGFAVIRRKQVHETN